MLTLVGVVVVAVGFAVRLNPLLVVIIAAFVTGWAGGIAPLAVLDAFGRAFHESRLVSASLLVLPVVGVLERAGLQERARALIARLEKVTVARLLFTYQLFRQITAAVGLISIAGQAQTVRPLVAPMAEAAAERDAPTMSDDDRARVRAMAAATDNIGVFFGEDVFLAIGSVMLMVAVLGHAGVTLEPLQLSAWAAPSALAALVAHGARLALFQRSLAPARPAAEEAA